MFVFFHLTFSELYAAAQTAPCGGRSLLGIKDSKQFVRQTINQRKKKTIIVPKPRLKQSELSFRNWGNGKKSLIFLISEQNNFDLQFVENKSYLPSDIITSMLLMSSKLQHVFFLTSFS